jgi:oligopeptide/dipeptide ABC transporter ATP-binding protein
VTTTASSTPGRSSEAEYDDPNGYVLEGQRLGKVYSSRRFSRPGKTASGVRAVSDVSVALRTGETLGLVGESGCGKTTTARMLLDLETPTTGDVLFRGRPIRDLTRQEYRSYRLGVQGVFQDPTSALSPRRRIQEIVSEPMLAAKTLRKKDATGRVEELLRQVGLPSTVAGAFPHELSGGMRQRVAVAQALSTNPAVIILDEPVSALDVSIRAQIMNLLKEIQSVYHVGYVLIAHDLATVKFLSDRVVAMYMGSIAESGPTNSLFKRAYHPYSLALLSAAAPIEPTGRQTGILLEGDPAPPADDEVGCPFSKRCWFRTSLGEPTRCETETPLLRPALGDSEHRVACHFVAEIEQDANRAEVLSSLSMPGDGPFEDTAP